MADLTVTKDIFVALDTDNDGFISKQHFINQMAEYLSQTEIEYNDYALRKLSIVNKYPDMIDFEDFQSFYYDLMEAKTPVEPDFDQDKTELDQSDSEIYESIIEESNNFNMSSSNLQGSVIDLLDASNKNDQYEKKRGDRQRSRSMINGATVQSAKLSYHTTRRPSNLNKRLSIDTGNNNDASCSLGDGYDDEVSVSCCMTTDSGLSSSVAMTTEEVDRLSKSYRAVVGELDEFKKKFEESHYRYNKQREMSKFHNDRIIMLEEQIRQLEQFQNENMANKSKELKHLTDSINHKRRKDSEERIQTERMFREDILNRLSTIETEYNVSRNEYEKIKKEYDILIKEKEQLRKELKVSVKRNLELENTLKNYQDSVKIQLEELQLERDNAEKINKELKDRLYLIESSHQSPKMRNYNRNSLPPNTPSNQHNRPMSWAPGTITNSNQGEISPQPPGSSSTLSQLSWTSSSPSSSSCTTISQLEQIVHKLTMDNRNLVEKVTHLETLEYFKRSNNGNCSNNYDHSSSNCSSLIYKCNNEKSLADEFEQLNYSQLKNELSKEREIATRLQIYIMGLTNRLMQDNYIKAFKQPSF